MSKRAVTHNEQEDARRWRVFIDRLSAVLPVLAVAAIICGIVFVLDVIQGHIDAMDGWLLFAAIAGYALLRYADKRGMI